MRVMPDSAVAIGWKPVWDVRMREPDAPADSPASTADLASADDRALVAAFLAGRREAFDVIVERHRRVVYQLCYRFVGNHEDAADLAQDVFVRAFKGLGSFKGNSSFTTWMYRIGVNTCLNRVAVKRPVTESIDAAPRIDDRAVDPLHAVMRDERAAVVRRAIEKLPPKQRATLVLRVYQELSHEEIARVLGSSVGAVKANFFHALGNLKRLLQSS
ncbi:MAG TPA: RNA polymerase sigma factor [Vicinamibacterales bacterium]|nr:RNA polymerase sigma factor [Vicinamibacterales bacterium]